MSDGATLAPLTTLDLFCGAGGITEGFREDKVVVSLFCAANR